MNAHMVRGNLIFWDTFEVAQRWLECDFVVVFWVLILELWRSLEFEDVLERRFEKWIWWKMNDRGLGRNFGFFDIFQVAVRWLECDFVIAFCVLMAELWRSLEFSSVSLRSFGKWIRWKMNDRGVGRNFEFWGIFEVAARWWECEFVIVFWVFMVEIWRFLSFGVF